MHLIQIREPHLEAGSLASLVRLCLRAVAGTRARVIVNDRLDVALVTGAHGVHLRASSPPARLVRSATPPGFLVGRSIHSAADAVRVSDEGGLDYLALRNRVPDALQAGDGRCAAWRASGPPWRPHRCRYWRLEASTGTGLPTLRSAGAAGFAAIRFWTQCPNRT